MNINSDAIEALLKMGRGDMRRVLNVLQSAAVAYPQEITFESLFLVTGNPVPKHIDAVFQSLLNDSFNDARKTLHDMCTLKGYVIPDVLTLLNERVLDTQLPRRMKAHLSRSWPTSSTAARPRRPRSSAVGARFGFRGGARRSRRPGPSSLSALPRVLIRGSAATTCCGFQWRVEHAFLLS